MTLTFQHVANGEINSSIQDKSQVYIIFHTIPFLIKNQSGKSINMVTIRKLKMVYRESNEINGEKIVLFDC